MIALKCVITRLAIACKTSLITDEPLMEVEMSNRSIIIFDRKLTLAESKERKLKSKSKTFRHVGRIDPDLLLVMQKLLNKNIAKEATAYEVKDHRTISALCLLKPAPVLMYRADDISQDVIKDYEKFVIFHDHLKNYKIRGLFADIEELNKRVERFSIVPHDSSAKDLVRVIEASIEQDCIAVKQSCDDYFAALVPS